MKLCDKHNVFRTIVSVKWWVFCSGSPNRWAMKDGHFAFPLLPVTKWCWRVFFQVCSHDLTTAHFEHHICGIARRCWPHTACQAFQPKHSIASSVFAYNPRFHEFGVILVRCGDLPPHSQSPLLPHLQPLALALTLAILVVVADQKLSFISTLVDHE